MELNETVMNKSDFKVGTIFMFRPPSEKYKKHMHPSIPMLIVDGDNSTVTCVPLTEVPSTHEVKSFLSKQMESNGYKSDINLNEIEVDGVPIQNNYPHTFTIPKDCIEFSMYEFIIKGENKKSIFSNIETSKFDIISEKSNISNFKKLGETQVLVLNYIQSPPTGHTTVRKKLYFIRDYNPIFQSYIQNKKIENMRNK